MHTSASVLPSGSGAPPQAGCPRLSRRASASLNWTSLLANGWLHGEAPEGLAPGQQGLRGPRGLLDPGDPGDTQALLARQGKCMLKCGIILQAAADWQRVARLPYAQQLLATEPGQAALQRTLGMSADAMRNMLAWRVWRLPVQGATPCIPILPERGMGCALGCLPAACFYFFFLPSFSCFLPFLFLLWRWFPTAPVTGQNVLLCAPAGDLVRAWAVGRAL